jgi:uncharacterized phage-associated protein
MYSIDKAVEAAAFFLNKKKEREMRYYDLIKFLYLADREHLMRKGRTITGDLHWSLPWGPVVGQTLDAVRHDAVDEWSEHIATDRALKRCKLIADAPASALSRGEIQSLEAVWSQFGHMDSQALMRYTHDLPEYVDTESRIEIRLEDLARAVGKSEDEVDAILAREREMNDVQRFKAKIGRSGKPAVA